MSPVEILVKSLCLSFVGLLAVQLLRRASAATRHVVLTTVLVVLCVLPVMTAVGPTWRIPFISVAKTAPTRSAPVSHVPPTLAPDEWRLGIDVKIRNTWLSISLILTVLIFSRLVRLRLLERRLQMAADSTLSGAVAEICREFGQRVLLLEGDESTPPMTWGLSRPVLLLPSTAREWSEEKLRAVVLHELAHIRRKDWLISVGAEFACAWLWFNPFTWLVRKRIEVESETAADDHVLEAGISAPNYAAHLIDLLKDLKSFPRTSPTAQAIGKPGNLERRILAILEESRPRGQVRGSVAVGTLAGFAAVASVVAAAAPTIIVERQLVAHASAPTDIASSNFALLPEPTDTHAIAKAVRAPSAVVHRAPPQVKIRVSPVSSPAMKSSSNVLSIGHVTPTLKNPNSLMKSGVLALLHKSVSR